MSSKKRYADIIEDEYGTYEDTNYTYPNKNKGKVLSSRLGNNKRYVDLTLILVLIFLICFGLVMLFSTSSYEAGLKFNDQTYYLKKQIKSALAGIIVMLILSYVPDYHLWKKFVVFVYVLSIGLILLLISFGSEAKGATRWLRIKGLPSIQPAEAAKVGTIIVAATLICLMRHKSETWKGFFVYFAILFPIALLIFVVSNDFSSAAIVLGIAFVMLFVSSKGYFKFAISTVTGTVLLSGLVYYILKYTDPSKNFRFGRIFAWNDVEAYADTIGFQTLQSLYAIGSGGIFGKGLGQSIQKMGFIPEAQNDMIFSVICEELGIVGGIAVIITFIIILWRMMIIANNAPDLFGSMLVVGVMGHISIQVMLNIAVVTNVVPNTGITLPFISYGGSSIFIQLSEIGIVMNVARKIKIV